MTIKTSDEVECDVKARAAKAGLSVSEYLLREPDPATDERPTLQEWLARVAVRPTLEVFGDTVKILHAERRARARHLARVCRLNIRER